MTDRLGSDERQLEADLALLDLDSVSIDTLRNMIVGTPSREGELGVDESPSGDFSGMSFISNGTEISVTGGRANVDGITGEIDLTGYQYGTAIPDSEVDTFERGDISPYSGDTGKWQVTTSTVKEGSYALVCDDNTDNTTLESYPGNGLNYYPVRGDRIGLYARANVQAIWFDFGKDSASSDRYRAELRPDEDYLSISGYGNSDSFSLSVSQGTWYYLLIGWGSDGEILLRLYNDKPADTKDLENEIASVSITNGDADSGGIGFGTTRTNSSNNQAWYDHIEVAKNAV